MLVSADCNTPPNNTTGSCAPISATTCFIQVQPPPAAAPLNLGGTNYTFSHQYCVPFSIPGGKIDWFNAMSNGWKFWASVIDEPANCSSLFAFQYKFCGNPVQISPVTGNNITYPGTVEIFNTWLKVPITGGRAFRFTVSAVTNCDNCICNVCGTTSYSGQSNWQFRSFQNYTVDDVDYIISGSNPVFDVPTLQPLSIFFDCNSTANNCP